MKLAIGTQTTDTRSYRKHLRAFISDQFNTKLKSVSAKILLYYTIARFISLIYLITKMI